MEATTTGTTSQASDLFIVLEPFRAGFADFVRALEPLSNTTDGPLLGSSDVYYRADTDIALLTIRFDRQTMTPQKLAWLTSVAARADLPVLDPGRLGFSDRRAFYEDYLPNYRVRVEARGGPQEALEELARLLALPDAPPLQPGASTPSARATSKDSQDHAPRPGPNTSPRVPLGTDPDGRYGAARSLGHGPGTRAAVRRPTAPPETVGHARAAAGVPRPPTRPPTSTTAPATRKNASTSPAAAGTTPGAHADAAGPIGAAKERERTLSYAAQSGGARPGRRRQGPAQTAPDSQRVHSPEDEVSASDSAAKRVLSASSLASQGPAIYPVGRRVPSPAPVTPTAREASGDGSQPGIVPPPPPAARRHSGVRPATSRLAAASEAPTPSGIAAPSQSPSQPAASSLPGGPSLVSALSQLSITPASDTPRGKQAALIVDDEESTPIQVRFLRGDHWASARLRALSLQGARLASGAPPRLGDRVQITLGLDHLDVMVGGEVTDVTTATQAAGTGEPSGFSLHFAPLDAPLRGKLVNLLKRAKQSGISLRPPPPRAAVRFPVRWPAGVVTSWGELNTAALDVSRSGLFLASGTAIGTRDIVFHLPMDTTGRALSGRAQVAREVTEEMAALRGLTRGYGVRIVDFTRNDSARYESFLDRIRLRTEKCIMVAARRERGTELGRGLVAAGYAVHTGNDLVALTESVSGEGPPPDAALIDSNLLAADANAAALKRALHTRQVPCLTIGTEQPERARAVVDHLLHIG